MGWRPRPLPPMDRSRASESTAGGVITRLLDAAGRLLGLPFHYRDERTSDEVVSRTHELVSRRELYRRTGIQTMPINTIFQLRAEAQGAAVSVAERIALIPDLFALWLSGALANELTAASTTGLLEAGSGQWATDLIARLRLPLRPFTGEVVTPGLALGSVLTGHDRAGGAVGTPVHTVTGHDTAAAFAAAPIKGAHCAILSSGTWSLLGVELDEPRLTEAAAAANLTNERGLEGTVRLLRNVMGLWLLEESRRAWTRGGEEVPLAGLQELAGAARADIPLFDPDDPSLLRPGTDMPQRISALCTAAGQPAPSGRGEMARSILASLACKYRIVLEQLEAVSGHRVEIVHVVGGGARNQLLCQLTADVCRRPLVAGPVEATALGNVLVQGIALGELAGLHDVRELSSRSILLARYEPGASGATAELFHRWLDVTAGGQTLRTTA